MARGEGVKKLSDLFAKYQNTLKAPQGHVIDTFCEVVKDVIGLPLTKKQVRYSSYSRTLSVAVSGPLKSEILLHKAELLNHLKGRLGEKNAPNTII